MNAYELAQELEWLQDEYYYIKESADMLRKQAEKISNMEIWEKKYLDRIEELEKEIKELHKIAQIMALQESNARKSLQNYKDYEKASEK
jgi:hypothetical protein